MNFITIRIFALYSPDCGGSGKQRNRSVLGNKLPVTPGIGITCGFSLIENRGTTVQQMSADNIGVAHTQPMWLAAQKTSPDLILNSFAMLHSRATRWLPLSRPISLRAPVVPDVYVMYKGQWP